MQHRLSLSLGALALLASGCITVSALVPEPADVKTPDGCVWVVAEGPGLHYSQSVALCCPDSAAEEGEKPVCEEAVWDRYKRQGRR